MGLFVSLGGVKIPPQRGYHKQQLPLLLRENHHHPLPLVNSEGEAEGGTILFRFTLENQ